MMDYALLEDAVRFIRGRWPGARPRCGLICGSGWSDVVSTFDAQASINYSLVPGLGAPGVAGHAGKLVLGTSSGIETLIFQGRRHFYEGEGWTPVALPIYVLKHMGAEVVVLTNAAGGIRKDLRAGSLMLLSDHINNIGSPLVGPHNPAWGPRFPDQTAVYDAELRTLAKKAAKHHGIELSEGIYLASSGPAYETPAEIKMFRTWGADAVGMSTVPEAMLACATGLRVLGLSCITNLAAGISPTPLTHEEVTAATTEAMPRMVKLLSALWKEFSGADI